MGEGRCDLREQAMTKKRPVVFEYVDYRAYLREYYMGQGQVRRSGPVPAHHPKLFGRPRYLWREAVEAEVSYRLGRLRGRPDLWIEHLIAASMAWGGLRGLPAPAER